MNRSHHQKIVQWSDEDDCFIGTCPTLFGGGVHGKNEQKVYRELCQVVAEVEALKQKSRSPRRRTARARTTRGGRRHRHTS